LLLSMTGHGEAQQQHDDVSVSAEVRTINGRYFKMSIRTNEGYSSLEWQVEPIVRKYIRRGSVQIGLQVHQQASADDYVINQQVVESYVRQLESLRGNMDAVAPIRLDALLALPGVISEQKAGNDDLEAAWPQVEKTIIAALENLHQMRSDEGKAMADDMTANCREIAEKLTEIEKRAPEVSLAFRVRLSDKLNTLLTEHDVTIEPSDIVREVGIFAERTDISEETVRLRSHLEQFGTIMALPESTGRKLEFLTQEMFRETNTIGSKANDAEIARHVIDIKACIERVREMIQNVE
jgi:uncharacterized protein (TIGR00255 family)